MHSGMIWNIPDVVEGCRKVDFQVDHTQTDKQTDTQTYIETCLAASSQPKIPTFLILSLINNVAALVLYTHNSFR